MLSHSAVPNVETNPAFSDWRALAALLRAAYAPMTGRIDPPTSLNAMGDEDIAAKARAEDLFLARANGAPVACGFGRPVDGVYEIGKVAVAQSYRKQGLARAIMDQAALRARALGLPALQLHARVELTENHATYRALGFHQHATFTHPGYARPTSVIFRRPV